MFICSVLCHVNLLVRTVFATICFPFFRHKVTSISRQNWSCEEIPSSQNSDKAALFSSVVVKTLLRAYKVNYNKSRCLNTMKSFLTFKIISTGIFKYFQNVLTMKLGITPSSRQRFFLIALYSPPSAVRNTVNARI